MKLFARYNRINITATILIFVFGSIAFYFVLQYVLVRQLDETLRGEQQEIVEFVKLHNQLPDIQNTKHQWITLQPTMFMQGRSRAKSILVYNKREDEQEWIRQLNFTVNTSTGMYSITVNKSETETEELLKGIILVTIGMIGVILLFNYLINRKMVTRLWQPFYNTIASIKEYHISSQQPLQLAKEPIDEINLLNESLNQMTHRIHRDFHALRSFTENASHEMQTPLAVIRSKVDTLLQETEGRKETIQQLLSIEDATHRLSKLHQSLLLLTRLENCQFLFDEPVDLENIIETKSEERKELLQAKNLSLQLNSVPVTLNFHPHLAEMLITNLMNNAIRYTPEGGSILIQLTTRQLTISNTAIGETLDTTRLFERFYKTDPASEGTGLGLAIIKQICNAAGFTIAYQLTNGKHQFTIQFIS